MDEALLRQYCDLRAHKLMFSGAQRFLFANRVVEHWSAGQQCETALKLAAEEVRT